MTLLAQRAYECSIIVAALLDAAENCLKYGREIGEKPSREFTENELLDLVRPSDLAIPYVLDDWSSQLVAQGKTSPMFNLERLARLVLNAWRTQVDSPNTRPDVLSIVAEFLANPDEPQTYEIVRFAIVLALRSKYSISYTPASLEELRKSYDALRSRHSNRQVRLLKKAHRADYFLVDLLCLEGSLRRRFSHAGAARYYESFRLGTFGISQARPLLLTPDEDSPRLVGETPDFGTVVNFAFTQPTGIPGLDAVTGGLLGPVLQGDEPVVSQATGVVTLIGGRPGTGKTSLSLLLARRLAELGSVVSYLATEEDPSILRAKTSTMAEPLSAAFADLAPAAGIASPNLRWPDRYSFQSLDEILKQLQHDFDSETKDPIGSLFFLPFPRVVVIDSITALIERMTLSGFQDPGMLGKIRRPLRHDLARIVKGLRDMGLCVIMIGSIADVEDSGLGYIVDNVFTLSLDAKVSPRHPVRLIAIEKTRLQKSNRGSHVFHVGGVTGCSVSPSLHAVLRDTKNRPEIPSNPDKRAVFWVPNDHEKAQTALRGIIEEATHPVTRRDRSQALIYGFGSAGKARLALSMALEPLISVTDFPNLSNYYERRIKRDPLLLSTEEASLSNTRLLILSFLYDEQYYKRHIFDLAKRRFLQPGRQSDPLLLRKTLSQTDIDTVAHVLAFRAGFIDPETVVGTVRQSLRRGELEGRPYTAVIIDGVHNVLMQFPLLQSEPLLWPTLYRFFRTRGITCITTFTFFGVQLESEQEGLPPRSARTNVTEVDADHFDFAVGPAQELFFHLLVGSCEYTYSVSRATSWTGRGGRRELVKMTEQSSPDSFARTSLYWDPKEASFRRYV